MKDLLKKIIASYLIDHPKNEKKKKKRNDNKNSHPPLPERTQQRIGASPPSPINERPWPEGAHVRELCLLPFLRLEASGGRKRDLDS